MKIEFLFFEGCPNAKESYNNLLEAIRELNIDTEVETINVKDLETAQKVKFLGSPSVYVNGIDIYSLSYPSDISYSCRTYNINGKITGILPKEFILERLKTILNK